MERFKAAAYCRLSHDDMNKQSESVENQRLIIEEYINRHSDEFCLSEIYTDDGISGMTYDRAAFTAMMQAVNEGRINAIIVKDLSRIGREQIETLNLIKREFILRNVRFIAITDNYDSFNPDKSDGLSTSVKLLLNDYYCADISKKIRASQRVKMSKGDFIGSHAPYGYIKAPDNKNRLVVDEEAAQVVRRIFSLYIGGMGKLTIARKLNSEGIPNPTTYKRQVLGQNYVNSNRLSETTYWTYSTIHKILKNEVYIGNTIQHKSEIKAYNIHKKVDVPQTEWQIVSSTHEPIITAEDFEIAGNMLKTKRRRLDPKQNTSKYMGLLFCRECGRAMNKFLSKPKKDGSRYITFKCGTYSKLGKDMCTVHSIKEAELDEIVLEQIRHNVRAALDESTCAIIREQSLKAVQKQHSGQLARIKDGIEKCLQKQKNMLHFLSDGTITAEDYRAFNEENKAELARLNEQLEILKERLADEDKQREEHNRWIENLLQYKDISQINIEILANLIDKIYISEKYGEKSVEIVFKFKNPLCDSG